LFSFVLCAGVIEYKDAKIQLLDLPGIIEGAAKGKGRGRQVIGVARTSDLVVMMLDAGKAEIQKELLTMELDAVGIRINRRRPGVTLRQKKTGGVSITSTCGDLTHLDVHQVRNILHVYKMHNVEVLVREDITVDEFIDVVEGNRVYLRCLYVINKIDNVHLDEVDRLAHAEHTVVISCRQFMHNHTCRCVRCVRHAALAKNVCRRSPPFFFCPCLFFLCALSEERLNLDILLERIWEGLAFIRVYTKPRGKRPDFSEPLIMRDGCSIEHVCHSIHRDMYKNFKYALVWGSSAKHQPQRVGITHSCEDEDVVQIMTK
jgi:ribosome-interacting GTPase 1